MNDEMMKLRRTLMATMLTFAPAAFAADPYPQHAIAFFDSGECPAGWTLYTRAEGRTIVPSADIGSTALKPLAPRQIPRHQHTASGTLTLDRVSLAVANGPDRTLAVAGEATIHATVSAVDSNMPYLQLLACMKMEKPPADLVPPPGVVAFSTERCSGAWEEAGGMTGRFVIGLPFGGAPGVSFGGRPLRSEEVRAHTHSVSGSWTPRQQGVAAASGCCNNSFGGNRAYSYTYGTSDNSAMLPYMQLQPCTPK